jgi:hypothetical protein
MFEPCGNEEGTLGETFSILVARLRPFPPAESHRFPRCLVIRPMMSRNAFELDLVPIDALVTLFLSKNKHTVLNDASSACHIAAH